MCGFNEFEKSLHLKWARKKFLNFFRFFFARFVYFARNLITFYEFMQMLNFRWKIESSIRFEYSTASDSRPENKYNSNVQ